MTNTLQIFSPVHGAILGGAMLDLCLRNVSGGGLNTSKNHLDCIVEVV